jgi:hypothetical protein
MPRMSRCLTRRSPLAPQWHGRWISALAVAVGCAATPPRSQAPKRSEIVVDEATVVQGRAPQTQVQRGLPALPTAAAASSPAFLRGLALAQAVLAAPGPGTPSDDTELSYDTWLKAELEPWLEARGKAVQEALEPLGQVIEAVDGAPNEQVVAAALVGLIYAQAHDELGSVPPPPAVRADEKLLHIYRDQVNQTSESWVESAVRALRHCARGAVAQRDASFGPWLDLCQQGLARLEHAAQAAKLLADTVSKEREAESPEAGNSQP